MVEEIELEELTAREPEETKPTTKSRKPQPKPRRKALLLIAGVVAAGVAAGGTYLHFASQVSTDDAQVTRTTRPSRPRSRATLQRFWSTTTRW